MGKVLKRAFSLKLKSFCKAGPLNQSYSKQESNLLRKNQSLNKEKDKTVGKSLNGNFRITYPDTITSVRVTGQKV